MTDTTARPDDHVGELRPYSDVQYDFEPHQSALPPIRRYLQDSWDRRHFVIAMAKADLRGARSRTILGELWAVIDPLFQAAIYWFVINTIRSSGSDGNARLQILVSGIFLFTFTSTAVSGGGRSIIKNKGLMLNSTFPRILLPATEVYKGLLDLGPALLVYGLIHFLLLGGTAGPGVFLLPLLILLQVFISAGLGLVFATVVVFIKDASNFLEYIMRILFFTTPILYPVDKLPSAAQTILQINPFFALFACFQAVVTGGVPSMGYLLQAVFWAVLLTVVGFRVFVSNERAFALRL